MESLERYIKSYGSGFSQSAKACQKIGKVDFDDRDPRIGQDARGYWECAEIAQLVEQRIRNASLMFVILVHLLGCPLPILDISGLKRTAFGKVLQS